MLYVQITTRRKKAFVEVVEDEPGGLEDNVLSPKQARELATQLRFQGLSAYEEDSLPF